MAIENPKYTYGVGVTAGTAVMQHATTRSQVIVADGTDKVLGLVTRPLIR